ncbi:MAG TPA: hypothetical protein VNI20_05545 [Fimbriimonadaceae bacterium]|nr:hypothetical protein [Fimbriimonadaceae bacterium]
MSRPDETHSSNEPFRQDVSDRVADSRGRGETEFEKPRGVNRVDVRHGLARATVSGLKDPIMESRLDVLSKVREAGVSIDFVKFSNGSMSFVAAESDHKTLSKVLKGAPCKSEVEPGCCVVTVHAVNMQDEEGLVARIVGQVIASGEEVDHVGDMHDRLLFVTDKETGDRLVERLRKSLIEGAAQ